MSCTEIDTGGCRVVCVDNECSSVSTTATPAASCPNPSHKPAATTELVTPETSTTPRPLPVIPFEITEWEWSEEEKHRILTVNRMPTFEDFVWEKVYEIDPTVNGAVNKPHEEYFWMIGTNEALKLKMVYFAYEREWLCGDKTMVTIKDSSSPVSLARYEVHQNYGVTDNWVGSMIPCVVTNPENSKEIKTMYIYF